MTVYLDASVVLRILLRQPKRLAAWGRWEAAYSSELLGIESRRVIDRLRVQAALNDHELADVHHDLTRIERAIGAIPLTRPVLRAPDPVRASRLALCTLTAQVLARGLDLLGIAAPEQI